MLNRTKPDNLSKTQNKFIKFIRDNVIFIFFFFVILVCILGGIYCYGLIPTHDKVCKIAEKFNTPTYSLPYYAAERYLIWMNMRSFFFVLHYGLNLLGIVASLLTVFYASSNRAINTNDIKTQKRNNKHIVFLSLLSVCFTFFCIFIQPEKKAYTTQHALRQLDACIIETINNNSMTADEKDKVIGNMIIDMEKYIEVRE